MTPLALDISIALIILLSTVVAYMRGIIKEMFTIVGLFMAAFIAFKLGHVLVHEFNGILNVPETGTSPKEDYVLFGLLSPAVASQAASYGSTFAVVLLIVLLLGRMFSKWVKEAGMEIVDKSLGGAFGFLRGFMVVFVIYVPFNFLVDSEDMPDWAKESKSVMAFESTFKWLNSELDLDEKIEDRSSDVVIKFSKLNMDEKSKKDKDADESGLVKTLSDVTDSLSDGASGLIDVISSSDEEVETESAKAKRIKKEKLEAERKKAEEKKYKEELEQIRQEERARIRKEEEASARRRMEEEAAAERIRQREIERVRREEIERIRQEEELKAQTTIEKNYDKVIDETTEAAASKVDEVEKEYISSPTINSYRKSGSYEAQGSEPEDFYNPNNPDEDVSDPYRKAYGE